MVSGNMEIERKQMNEVFLFPTRKRTEVGVCLLLT